MNILGKAHFIAVLFLAGSLQAAQLSFDVPFTETKYQIVLNSCMQIWGDMCVLRDHQEINAERLLLVDAVLGRMTFLDTTLSQIVASESVAQPKDSDVSYLGQLLIRLESCCDQILVWDRNEKVQCFKPLIKAMQSKLKY